MSERLEAIRERLEGATDGPWVWPERGEAHPPFSARDLRRYDDCLVSLSPDEAKKGWDGGAEPKVLIVTDIGAYPPHGADREFVARAPTDIRYLLDTVERLEARRDKLQGLVDDFREDTDCRFDHHGYCQAHGWLEEYNCPEGRARDLLADCDGESTDG